MSYSVIDNIAVELIATGILVGIKIFYSFFKKKKLENNNLDDIEKIESHGNMTWTPKIVKIIIEANQNNLNKLETHDLLKNRLSEIEYYSLYNKFINKAKKKNCSVKDLLIKRIGDILKEAEEISRYGKSNLDDWVYNRNNARSFIWRSEKKREYEKKIKIN